MSIRPIDPLIMNNTPHVGKLASDKTTHEVNAQSQSAMVVKEDTEHKVHQVTTLDKSDSQNKINRETDRESKDQQHKKKKKNEEEEGSIIDIRI